MFARTFGCARFIYNKMLGDRLDYYKETGKKLNNTPAQYKAKFPWLKEVDSLALANAKLNLNKAYNNFWNNRKHFGKPRFKSRKTGLYEQSERFCSIRGKQDKTAENWLGEDMFAPSVAGKQYHKYCHHKQNALRKILHQHIGGI